jgi:FKBP-type peptidyl-prolyl cis-trans isomerase SlyD
LKIQKNAVVVADFQLFDGGGELVDSSASGGPLTYLHGADELLPGLEQALAGHGVGDALTVELTPEEAFGERDEALVDRAPRANFPGIEHIERGMQFQTEMDDGAPIVVTVIDVDDHWVTVDGNHEMAGRHLRFELEVVEVREATPEEIAHGHVHGPGDACGH